MEMNLFSDSQEDMRTKTYIDSLCKQFGFKMCHYESRPGRKEKMQFIQFGLYLLGFLKMPNLIDLSLKS